MKNNVTITIPTDTGKQTTQPRWWKLLGKRHAASSGIKVGIPTDGLKSIAINPQTNEFTITRAEHRFSDDGAKRLLDAIFTNHEDEDETTEEESGDETSQSPDGDQDDDLTALAEATGVLTDSQGGEQQ